MSTADSFPTSLSSIQTFLVILARRRNHRHCQTTCTSRTTRTSGIRGSFVWAEPLFLQAQPFHGGRTLDCYRVTQKRKKCYRITQWSKKIPDAYIIVQGSRTKHWKNKHKHIHSLGNRGSNWSRVPLPSRHQRGALFGVRELFPINIFLLLIRSNKRGRVRDTKGLWPRCVKVKPLHKQEPFYIGYSCCTRVKSSRNLCTIPNFSEGLLAWSTGRDWETK